MLPRNNSLLFVRDFFNMGENINSHLTNQHTYLFEHVMQRIGRKAIISQFGFCFHRDGMRKSALSAAFPHNHKTSHSQAMDSSIPHDDSTKRILKNFHYVRRYLYL